MTAVNGTGPFARLALTIATTAITIKLTVMAILTVAGQNRAAPIVRASLTVAMKFKLANNRILVLLRSTACRPARFPTQMWPRLVAPSTLLPQAPMHSLHLTLLQHAIPLANKAPSATPSARMQIFGVTETTAATTSANVLKNRVRKVIQLASMAACPITPINIIVLRRWPFFDAMMSAKLASNALDFRRKPAATIKTRTSIAPGAHDAL